MRAKRLVVPCCLALVVTAFFFRIVLGERFYAFDFFQTFVPLRSILAEAWLHGVPMWTSRLGNGSPIFLSPAYGVLYLPNLLYLGTDPSRSMTVLTVVHFIGGAIGAWCLARRYKLSRSGAWTAAVAFALSGPAVSSIAYTNLAWPLAWLPWALLAHEDAVRGQVWRGVFGLAFVWFSMLSMGDPVVLVSALAGSALIVLRDSFAVATERPWPMRLTRALLPPAVAGLSALVLASPLLVAIARYLPHSVRGAGFKAGGIVQWSLHPLLFAGVILPNPYGDPSLFGRARFWANALALDRGRPLLAGLYLGGLIVALAVLGALRRTPQRNLLLVWFGLLVLLALGKYGPIYPLVGEASGFDALRYPTKWIVPAMLPMALLSAFGLDYLGESGSNVAVARRGASVFLAVLALLAAASLGSMAGLDRKLVSLASQPDIPIGGVPFDLYVRSTWISAAAWSAAPLALALLALVYAGRPRARFTLTALPVIAALATCDVAFANRDLAPTITRDFYDVPRAAAAILADPAGHGRVFVEDYESEGHPLRYLRMPVSDQEAMRPFHEDMQSYVGASAGLDLAFNPDTEAFSPVTYARAGVLMHTAPLRERLMILGAAGATHIVTFRPPQGLLVNPLATIPGAFDHPLLVFRNPFALPRARIVPRLTPYVANEGFIHAVQSAPDDLFRHTALVEGEDLRAAGLSGGDTRAEGGTAHVVAEDGRSLTLQVEGPGGFLIVSDALAPGWTAEVDGQSAKLLRADLAFRAVPVPAGTHRVAMRYNPWL